MGLVWTILLLLGAMALVGFGLVVFALYSAVRGQSSPKARITLLDVDRHPLAGKLLDAAEQHEPWAEAHRFDWAGLFQFAAPGNVPAYLAVWQRLGTDDYLALYIMVDLHGKIRATVIEFVSLYDGERSLDTANSAAAMLFPPVDGHWKQAFPGMSIDALHAAHVESDGFLKGQVHVKARRDTRDLEAILLESVQKAAKAVRARTLWPLRGVWWWITQRARCNKSVAQQVFRQGR